MRWQHCICDVVNAWGIFSIVTELFTLSYSEGVASLSVTSITEALAVKVLIVVSATAWMFETALNLLWDWSLVYFISRDLVTRLIRERGLILTMQFPLSKVVRIIYNYVCVFVKEFDLHAKF